MALAYFYFDGSDQDKQTDENLLSSLVLTFTAKAGKYSLLQNLYQKHNQLHKPTVSELMDVLMTLVGVFKETYIVIDALDECCQFDEVSNIIANILGWKLPNCHLLVTSRREKHILDALYQYLPAEVVLSKKRVHNDIALYTRETVRKVQQFKRWDKGLEKTITRKLVKKSGGM